MLMWFSPRSPATSASAPGRFDSSIDSTSVSVIGRFSFVRTCRADSGFSATKRRTPCSCESTSVIAPYRGDPKRVEARVYRADGSLSIVDANGSLEGEAVLPGFTCSLREILA